MRWVTLGAVLALGVAVVAAGWRFDTALRAQRARVSRGSQIVVSPRFGTIEYAAVGRGTAVLVAHGAGGGFDQVLAASGRWVAAGYEVIAPSRFGFLRSSSPSDPSPRQQADAFAELLDSLHVRRLPVVGISAGAPAALQFAVRHPDRCRSLVVIVPAAAAAGKALPARGPLPEQGPVARAITMRLMRSDLLYWLGLTLAPDRMLRSVLGCDPAVAAAAGPDERRRAHDILWHLLPLSQRSRGLLNDVRFVSTPQTIAFDQIEAPTLVVSVEDDPYGTAAAARVIAASIRGARLVTYPTGGHVWIGHDAEMFAEIDGFLKGH